MLVKLLSQEVEVTRSLSSIIKSPFINYATNNKKFIVGDNLYSDNNNDNHLDNDNLIKTIEEEKKHIKEMSEDIINKAMLEAQCIVEEANKKAIDIASEAYNEALDNGFKEGIIKGEQEAIELRQEAESILQKARDEKEEMFKDIEPKMVNILIELVKNLTSYVIEKEDIIIYLIKKGFSEIEIMEDINIHVSDDDFEFVNKNKKKLYENISQNINLEIVKDETLASNDCILETKLGNLDCSLNTRLNGLTSDLKLIANSLNS